MTSEYNKMSKHDDTRCGLSDVLHCESGVHNSGQYQVGLSSRCIITNSKQPPRQETVAITDAYFLIFFPLAFPFPLPTLGPGLPPMGVIVCTNRNLPPSNRNSWLSAKLPNVKK